MIPSTVTQVAVLLVALVPGVVYRATRTRVTGRNANDHSLAHRALRAFVASVIFVATYAIMLGDRAKDYLALPPTEPVKSLGGAFLVGGVAIPILAGLVANALAAALEGARRKLIYEADFEPGSRADRAYAVVGWVNSNILGNVDELRPWDKRVPGLAPAWVRIRKVDGTFAMGYLDAGGYVSTYPDPPSLYLSEQVNVDEHGAFESRMEHSKGLWYQLQEGDIVEFVAAGDKPDEVIAESEVHDGGLETDT